MAVKLPPLGGRPRGSPVWQGDALHPTPRPLGVGLFERHAAWPGFYRRGTTGATARRSGRAKALHPLLRAAAQGAPEPVPVTPTPTIAEGIAIGKPMRGEEILRLAKKHGVRFVHAPEDKILGARAALARKGVYCEHTTAANYAAYLEYRRLNGPTPDTLLTMCGAGLKSDH